MVDEIGRRYNFNELENESFPSGWLLEALPLLEAHVRRR